MVLKVELLHDGAAPVFSLIGRIRSPDVQRLKARLDGIEPPAALDLAGVSLVDLDAVHFLARLQERGFALDHAPAYVREWIRLETLQWKG